MKKCSLCYGENGDAATVCQWCNNKLASIRHGAGAPHSDGTNLISAGVIIAAVIVFGTIGVNRSCGGGKEPSKHAKTSYSVPKEPAHERISGDHWFGCSDRDYFDKLSRYAVQKDQEAFGQALAAGLLTGTCTMFKAGEQIHLMETAIFSGLVKLRRQGQAQEYWTNLEAVR